MALNYNDVREQLAEIEAAIEVGTTLEANLQDQLDVAQQELRAANRQRTAFRSILKAADEPYDKEDT